MALRAVQFGAGNIGRGFMGQLFHESGYTTTFIDVAPELLDALNTRGSYPIRIVGPEPQTLTISQVQGLSALDAVAAARAVADADVMATAVGANVLTKIAPTVAAGIALRMAESCHPPLNIILCENLLHAADAFAALIEPLLPDAYRAEWRDHVGLVEASIGRMVPVMTAAQRAEDPLLVCVEPYCELPVDAAGFRGAIPPIAHMKAMANFQAYVERKLYIHNAGHAATAYLGYLRGHEYIAGAIEDPTVAAPVRAMLEQAKHGLVARHAMDETALQDHIDDLLYRFANHALGDQVTRVARDPIRKLQPGDRLLGTVALCLETGNPADAAGFATAAAIRYDQPDDDAARAVQDVFRAAGLDGVLTEICRLPANSPLRAPIQAGHERLVREGWIGA